MRAYIIGCAACFMDRPLSPSARLATQIAAGHRVRVSGGGGAVLRSGPAPVQVYLPHDGYLAWLLPQDWDKLREAAAPYVPPPPVDAAAVQAAVPGVLAFVAAAGAVPNTCEWARGTPLRHAALSYRAPLGIRVGLVADPPAISIPPPPPQLPVGRHHAPQLRLQRPHAGRIRFAGAAQAGGAMRAPSGCIPPSWHG